MINYIIYKKGTTVVYINENNKVKNRKMLTYSIRRDDDTGLGYFMGLIRFDGGWRQYITEFEPNTKWSSGCKRKICDFEDLITKKWRDKIKLKSQSI